jgi:hypothetical protein
MNRWDVFAVLIVPMAAFFVLFVLGFKTTYLVSLLVFFLIPSIYLSLRKKERVKKVALFTLITTIPLYFIIDILAYLGKDWIVPASLFPFRILGVLPIEDFIWLFLVTYLVLIIYESISKDKFKPALGGRVTLMIAILYPLLLIAVGLFYLYPSLNIPYAFDILGFGLLLIPAVLVILRFPSYAITFLKVQILFSVIHLPFELVGDKYGFWLYQGSYYIGWVKILGVSMPLEEMMFVMMFGAFAACAYYVFFTAQRIHKKKFLGL